MRKIRLISLAFGFALTATLGTAALAQDDALDRLLEKAQGENKEAGKPAADADKPGDAKPAADRPKSDKPKADPQDKALDDLLEKLGQSDDAPDTTGRAKPPGEPKPDDASKPSPGESKSDPLNPQQKPLDQHLEELTGRKRKNPQDDEADQKSDPSEGALAEAIKKMREVEKKLGDKETGESTRQKQEQIVKDLDQMIKLARQARNQQRQRGNPQQGQQQQQGEEQNANDPQRGTQASKPKKPTGRDALAENKDIWGHLPPEVRAEIENMFNEEALPMKRSLIDRYYLSINKKSTESADK